MEEDADKKKADDLIRRMNEGDPEAANDVYTLLYAEFRRMAGSYMSHQPRNHTLQPTALVNEALLRILKQDEPSFTSREEFFCHTARAMRCVLVDYGRKRDRHKRRSEGKRIDIELIIENYAVKSIDVVAMGDILDLLAAKDPRAAMIFELIHFGKLTIDETANIVKVARKTVERDWNYAISWLEDQLAEK